VPRSGGHLSDDEEPFRGDVLEIEAEQDRSGATITLVGEFDMTGSERFWAFVREVPGASPRSVVVDASGLEFGDSTGSIAIVRARDAATEVGVGVHVTSSSEALRRIAGYAGSTTSCLRVTAPEAEAAPGKRRPGAAGAGV
jgi:anti-anti-sigma factor